MLSWSGRHPWWSSKWPGVDGCLGMPDQGRARATRRTRSHRFWLMLAGAAVVPATAATAGTSAATRAAPRTVVIVDDDGMQCPGADVSTIQAAVRTASAGSLVRVCPGVYKGLVRIDKPLRLVGPIGSVA